MKRRKPGDKSRRKTWGSWFLTKVLLALFPPGARAQRGELCQSSLDKTHSWLTCKGAQGFSLLANGVLDNQLQRTIEGGIGISDLYSSRFPFLSCAFTCFLWLKSFNTCLIPISFPLSEFSHLLVLSLNTHSISRLDTPLVSLLCAVSLRQA